MKLPQFLPRRLPGVTACARAKVAIPNRAAPLPLVAAALVVLTLAAATFFLVRPAFAEDGDLLSATLNVQAIGTFISGCQQGDDTSDYRSDEDVLSDDDFIVDDTTYTVTIFYINAIRDSLQLLIKVTPEPENQLDGLRMHLDMTEFDFADATRSATGSYQWDSTLSWSPGDAVDVRIALPPPDPPTNLNARADAPIRVKLNWSPVRGSSGYKIEWSADGSDPWALLYDWPPNYGVHTADNTITSGTTRHYRVRAVNAAGESDPSNVVSATTPTLVDSDGGQFNFGAVRSEFESLRDQKVFQYNFEAGEKYLFTIRGRAFKHRVIVTDPDGDEIENFALAEHHFDPRITANQTGLHQVKISHGGSVGLTTGDDHSLAAGWFTFHLVPATDEEDITLELTGGASSTKAAAVLNTWLDVDRFNIVVHTGKAYTVRVIGHERTNGEASTPWISRAQFRMSNGGYSENNMALPWVEGQTKQVKWTGTSDLANNYEFQAFVIDLRRHGYNGAERKLRIYVTSTQRPGTYPYDLGGYEVELQEINPRNRHLPLRAWFVSQPAQHDGKKRVKVQVEFTEAIEESPENVSEHSVQVEGGRVTSVRQVGNQPAGGAAGRSSDGPEDGQETEQVWEFEIEPDSDDDLTIRIDGGDSCDEPGAICTADGRSLYKGISTTVEGPKGPLTAEFKRLPDKHDGEEAAFTFRVAFSEHIQPLRHASFKVDGGEVTGTRRVDGRHDLWRITVEPDSDEDVTITLPGDRECGTAGAVCTRGNDPTPLMNSLSATVAWDSNTAATGTPTISGTPQVGETLTVDTSGIADEDGLENVSYSYRWLVKEGTTVTHTAGWTDSTFTLADAVEGKAISVQVSFSDDAGNEESLIGVDAAAWSATMTVEWVYQGYGYYSTDVKEAGSLSPDSFNVDGTTYTVKMVETKGWWMYIGLDRELPFDFVLELDGTRFVSDDASFRSYSYGNIYRWEGKGLSLRDGDTVEVRLLRAFDDETAVNSVATGAPTISGTVQVGETLMADTSGIADEDGLTNADFTYQWLADDTEIQGATNADYTLTDADEGKTIKVQVSFTDNADNDETLTSTATDEVAAATAPNSPATGAPAITGTAQVGETLTADTSGIADEDGLDNVLFSYQWLADDTAIQGATNSTYTLADADEGNAIKVQVTFTDDADNEETLTSTATVTVAASTQPNSPAMGAATISGTVQVGGTLTADTSGISDDDGLDNVSFSYQWLADDTVIQGATNSTYTLADADEGKAIKVHVSFTDNTGNDETLTSAATAVVSAAAQPNNPATSAPTVSGTAQVGETLTADTSGIADADGLTNATFTYQWLADDTDIAGATGSTYTLVEADEGKTVKVRVSFTDDAGNGETLTSEATDPVTATTQPNSPATGAPTIRGTVQVGETLTADTSGIADEDRLDNASFSYQWLADDDTISGATNSTYTLVDADAGKSISVRVSFTDDADNEETLTSVTTDSVTAAPEPPAQPTGLSSTVSHDTVTLNWEDPNDDSITGYVILRRDKEIHEEGTFVTVEDDTESADNTYTDDTVEPSKQYVYRIKAINAHGLSEISSWVRAYTPATSEPPAKPTGLSATATHDQAVLTWDNPGDDGITGYVILRRNQETDAEGEFTELVSNTGSADTTYSDESVVAETRYTYRIKAINEHGVSERSRWFHIDTPAAPVPAKPTGLSATATHDQVTLTWDDPNDDSIDGYVILRRNRDTDAKGEFTELVADTGSAHTTYSDDTVAAETRYTYRIKAINEHGVSERSRWFHLDTSAAPDPEG